MELVRRVASRNITKKGVNMVRAILAVNNEE